MPYLIQSNDTSSESNVFLSIFDQLHWTVTSDSKCKTLPETASAVVTQQTKLYTLPRTVMTPTIITFPSSPLNLDIQTTYTTTTPNINITMSPVQTRSLTRRLYNRLSSRVTSPPEEAPIFSLPECLIRDISDLLPLASQASLALTCKLYKYLFPKILTHPDLKYPRFKDLIKPSISVYGDDSQRTQFLIQLEDPQRAFCSACLKLHARDEFSPQTELDKPARERKCMPHAGIVDLCPCICLTPRDKARIIRCIKRKDARTLRSLEGDTWEGYAVEGDKNGMPRLTHKCWIAGGEDENPTENGGDGEVRIHLSLEIEVLDWVMVMVRYRYAVYEPEGPSAAVDADADGDAIPSAGVVAALAAVAAGAGAGAGAGPATGTTATDIDKPKPIIRCPHMESLQNSELKRPLVECTQDALADNAKRTEPERPVILRYKRKLGSPGWPSADEEWENQSRHMKDKYFQRIWKNTHKESK
ncbi:hypothetical protein BJX70DRAFT_401194 [Aspergillus crustosus]